VEELVVVEEEEEDWEVAVVEDLLGLLGQVMEGVQVYVVWVMVVVKVMVVQMGEPQNDLSEVEGQLTVVEDG
jgi:hypothetical protein